MKEIDIQDYIYTNPEILFPIGKITEKAREYSIHGKRIDLLFVVDGVRYIVEVKNVPIQREHIGQVIEYYGLMRHYMQDNNLAMVLVSSSIPPWRAAYLEELGIRCVEIPSVPTTEHERKRIQKESSTYSKKAKYKTEAEFAFGNEARVSYEDITDPTSRKGMAFAHQMLRDSLEPVRKSFGEYDVVPFSVARPTSLDFDMEYDPARNHGIKEFTRGGIWWAYRFGFSEDLPPNDVPNISIIVNTTGLDVTLNAELQPSQKIMVGRIREFTSEFDRLLADHGRLWLKTYLKLEHQPRFYHWILADLMEPGEFDGAAILRLRLEHENRFEEERERWIRNIIAENKELTKALIHHLETRNKRLNLAIRLVEPFQKKAAFWSLPIGAQVTEIVGAVQRLKPLLDFFVK
jgi:hypothetical protein